MLLPRILELISLLQRSDSPLPALWEVSRAIFLNIDSILPEWRFREAS